MANEPGDSGDRDSQGRIVGRSHLTERQLRFVTELRKGITQTEAARRAGYSAPAVRASELVRFGPVAALIRAGRARIVSQGASAAIKLMVDTALGKATPSRVQYDAARFLIEYEKTMGDQGEKDSDNKPIREKSLAELEDMANRIKGAREVAIVPELPADAVQVIDNTEEHTP